MNAMMEALAKAGMAVNSEVSFERYEKFSDIRLPFGSLVNNGDGEEYMPFGRSCLDGLNYIRESAESVTREDIDRLCPSINPDDPFKAFLMENAERVKVINRGSYQRVSNGYLGQSQDYDLKYDTEFGFADVVFRFCFDHQVMRVKPAYHGDALSVIYQKHILDDIHTFSGSKYIYSIDDEMMILEVIKRYMDEFEFIPLYISTYDGVTISHGAYRDLDGWRHDKVTAPCLGINIKKHEDIMKRLSAWIEKGGIIKDDRYYLILENWKEDGKPLYLTRYNIES